MPTLSELANQLDENSRKDADATKQASRIAFETLRSEVANSLTAALDGIRDDTAQIASRHRDQVDQIWADALLATNRAAIRLWVRSLVPFVLWGLLVATLLLLTLVWVGVARSAASSPETTFSTSPMPALETQEKDGEIYVRIDPKSIFRRSDGAIFARPVR
jgi:hypothetical protein